MIPNFNTPSSSHSSQPIEPPVITRHELESLLKAWILNPSTHVSIEVGKKIAKKILIFYTLETDSKYAPYRKQALEIIDCSARSFPDIFSYPPFTRLTSLNLQMGLSELPETISKLQALKSLNISNNTLQQLPDSISQLPKLEDLNVSHNQLTELPEDLHQLSQLQKLDVSFNTIRELPNNLDRLQNLTTLNLSYNNLSTLPKSFSQCKSLTHLDLSRNKFSQVPESITRLRQIKELNLSENTLSSLPDISQWTELQRLDLRNNRFIEWPKDLESLSNQAALLLDYHFSAWKAATLIQEPISDSEASEISDNESSHTSDSESSDEDSSKKSIATLQDRIEIPNNSSPVEGIRKRKAEKFRIQSEIARKVLKKTPL